MPTFSFHNKTYEVDSEGFLLNYKQWDEDFAEGVAPKVQLTQGLLKEHWKIIYSIRCMYEDMGKCPLIYQVCRKNGLHYKDCKRLFPTGYLRGAWHLSLKGGDVA